MRRAMSSMAFISSGGLAFSDCSYKGGKALYIVFRDELGLVSVPVDESGIQFTDGIAYFSDGEKEYRIPMNALEEIIHPDQIPAF